MVCWPELEHTCICNALLERQKKKKVGRSEQPKLTVVKTFKGEGYFVVPGPVNRNIKLRAYLDQIRDEVCEPNVKVRRKVKILISTSGVSVMNYMSAVYNTRGPKKRQRVAFLP